MDKLAISVPYNGRITAFVLIGASALFIGCSVWLVIYRLYFSPISKFPGPKLAAATSMYEFYYDWWLNGKYIFKIEEMHKKYGTSSFFEYQFSLHCRKPVRGVQESLIYGFRRADRSSDS